MSQPNFDRFWAWWTEAGPRSAAAIDRGTVADLVNEISAQVMQLDSEPDPDWAFYREGIYGVFERR